MSSTFAKEVKCEKIVDTNWIFSVGKQKTCQMWQITIIDSPDVTISSDRDEYMGALHFNNNKNISFLPVKVSENFPYLLAYAGHCSVKEIYLENFEGLRKLKVLNLIGNQIEKISNDTFDDLTALERLYLGKVKKNIKLLLTVFTFSSSQQNQVYEW